LLPVFALSLFASLLCSGFWILDLGFWRLRPTLAASSLRAKLRRKKDECEDLTISIACSPRGGNSNFQFPLSLAFCIAKLFDWLLDWRQNKTAKAAKTKRPKIHFQVHFLHASAEDDLALGSWSFPEFVSVFLKWVKKITRLIKYILVVIVGSSNCKGYIFYKRYQDFLIF